MLAEMGIRVFAPEAHDPVPAADRAPPVPAPQAGELAHLRPATMERPPPPPRPVPQRVSAPIAEGADWDTLRAAVTSQLPEGSAKVVFGTGDLQADWMIVGDVPAEEEEAQGTPFAGDPGRLMDNMLAALGASRRKGAYLTHVVKWRPPGNRMTTPEELAQSEPFLRRQVELVQPRVILAMGRLAVQALLQTSEPIGKLRGQVHRYHGAPVVVTYHPAYLLRNPADKARAWIDLCLAQSLVRAPV
ncbi:MAG: uracil-DNA glycosylase, 4 family protein [Ramlibacter sp.]|nr:uracil-DNA glycosylase, 4 family protein [Ramlibacter sp.]